MFLFKRKVNVEDDPVVCDQYREVTNILETIDILQSAALGYIHKINELNSGMIDIALAAAHMKNLKDFNTDENKERQELCCWLHHDFKSISLNSVPPLVKQLQIRVVDALESYKIQLDDIKKRLYEREILRQKKISLQNEIDTSTNLSKKAHSEDTLATVSRNLGEMTPKILEDLTRLTSSKAKLLHQPTLALYHHNREFFSSASLGCTDNKYHNDLLPSSCSNKCNVVTIRTSDAHTAVDTTLEVENNEKTSLRDRDHLNHMTSLNETTIVHSSTTNFSRKKDNHICDDHINVAYSNEDTHAILREELMIAAGEMKTLPIALHENETLHWEFRTKSYDIDFGVVFVPSKATNKNDNNNTYIVTKQDTNNPANYTSTDIDCDDNDNNNNNNNNNEEKITPQAANLEASRELISTVKNSGVSLAHDNYIHTGESSYSINKTGDNTATNNVDTKHQFSENNKNIEHTFYSKVIKVINVHRVNSHKTLVSGNFTAPLCSEGGVLYIRWDNSFSIFRKKKVVYKILHNNNNCNTPGDFSACNSKSSVWSEEIDPTSGHTFFYNSITQESTWEKPNDFNDRTSIPDINNNDIIIEENNSNSNSSNKQGSRPNTISISTDVDDNNNNNNIPIDGCSNSSSSSSGKICEKPLTPQSLRIKTIINEYPVEIRELLKSPSNTANDNTDNDNTDNDSSLDNSMKEEDDITLIINNK